MRVNYLVVIFFSILLIFSAKAYAEALQGANDTAWIKLSSPVEESTVFDKKPVIRCRITVPFSGENLFVMLDDADVTGIINVSEDGFEFVPVQVLSSGKHSLNVVLTMPDKKEYERDFSFTVRHTKVFEEIYSNNDVNFLYESRLERHVKGTTENTPHSMIESNFSSDHRIKIKSFEGGLVTDIRYFDQSGSVDLTAIKKFTLSRYLLYLKYETERALLHGEAGDVNVDETANTINALSLRGVKLNAGFDNYRFTYFDLSLMPVNDLEKFGEEGGLDFGSENRIRGVSGKADFFGKKSTFKVIHFYGKEKGESYGTWYESGGREGRTTGFLLKTDFFSQKFMTEAEYDTTRYDQDTDDALPGQTDYASRFKLDGYLGKYTYEGTYEYAGPAYGSIGNAGAQRDREGFMLKGGGNYNIQSVDLSFSKYNDNVKSDPLLPTIHTYQTGLNYNFYKFQNVPAGLSYQKTDIKSRKEPEGTSPSGTVIDNVTGRISFFRDQWDIGFDVNYEQYNEKYSKENDNKNTTYTVSAGYNSEKFSITSNLSLNHLRNDFTKAVTDTYTENLSIWGSVLKKKLDYDVGYTFYKVEAKDDSSSSESNSLNFRISHILAKQLYWFANPTAGIRGSYSDAYDRIQDTKANDFVILLFVSTGMPISF